MTASSLLLLALLITPLSCIAAVDPLWREFFLVNTCGCNLTLFFVDHEMNERLLIKADIESVSQINSTGLVGDELEVVETVNTTANCTGRKATFHINDNYDQGMFITDIIRVDRQEITQL